MMADKHKYYDRDGKPVSLYWLVRNEPEWAKSWLERYRDEAERLQAELKTANSEKQRNLLLANINLKQSVALQAENAKLREASTVILDWAKDRVFVGYEASMFVKLQEAVAAQEDK